MRENTNYEDVYKKLLDYEEGAHRRNLMRIKIGIYCLLIVPLLFLFLLFITNSNKVVFLILWILSLFAISIYLIAVEYGDYKLSHKISYLTGDEFDHVSLLEPEIANIEALIAQAKEKRKEAEQDGEDMEDISE